MEAPLVRMFRKSLSEKVTLVQIRKLLRKQQPSKDLGRKLETGTRNPPMWLRPSEGETSR